MEMRILANMSRTLLEDRWKQQLGDQLWKEAFQACGSPKEWSAFVKSHGSLTSLPELKTQFGLIANEVLAVRAQRVKRVVELPEI